jgi:hypothetical protein
MAEQSGIRIHSVYLFVRARLRFEASGVMQTNHAKPIIISTPFSASLQHKYIITDRTFGMFSGFIFALQLLLCFHIMVVS